MVHCFWLIIQQQLVHLLLSAHHMQIKDRHYTQAINWRELARRDEPVSEILAFGTVFTSQQAALLNPCKKSLWIYCYSSFTVQHLHFESLHNKYNLATSVFQLTNVCQCLCLELLIIPVWCTPLRLCACLSLTNITHDKLTEVFLFSLSVVTIIFTRLQSFVLKQQHSLLQPDLLLVVISLLEINNKKINTESSKKTSL